MKPPIAQFVALLVLTAVLIVGAKLYGGDKKEVSMTTSSPMVQNQTAKQIARIETDKGEIVIELFPKDAPKTVENFVTLANRGYYNGIVFHRVIQDFMIQTGDPTGTGTGGESAFGADFADEINDHKIVAGSVAMANRGPNTNGSQFFIVTEKAQTHLDGKHTVFGQITQGMDVVRAIAAVAVDNNDKPLEPIHMKTITITTQ
jgi:cyclophilin family peptidyl-prolyl cis-trans isomerase